MKSPCIILLSNTTWYTYNFRKNLITFLIDKKYRVVCISPPDEYVDKLRSLGCTYYPISLSGSSINPLREVKYLLQIGKYISRLSPVSILSFTPKPNIYSSLIAGLIGIPVIINISGLGTLFLRNSLVRYIAVILYKISLARSGTVFFQNHDDLNQFESLGIISPTTHSVRILPGSGVDLDYFSPTEQNIKNDPFIFLFSGRTLKDKGILEFIEATRQLRNRGYKFESRVIGSSKVYNSSSVPQSRITKWVEDGVINYLGMRDDMREQIKQVNCLVLPSYREGTPRSLLEGASMGKPIITTNTAGCKNVVDDQITGYLVKVGDAEDLADKMEQMLRLTDSERALMGERGREKMLREYDEKFVLKEYDETLKLLEKISY